MSYVSCTVQFFICTKHCDSSKCVLHSHCKKQIWFICVDVLYFVLTVQLLWRQRGVLKFFFNFFNKFLTTQGLSLLQVHSNSSTCAVFYSGISDSPPPLSCLNKMWTEHQFYQWTFRAPTPWEDVVGMPGQWASKIGTPKGPHLTNVIVRLTDYQQCFALPALTVGLPCPPPLHLP